jgi:hypothetical protein
MIVFSLIYLFTVDHTIHKEITNDSNRSHIMVYVAEVRYFSFEDSSARMPTDANLCSRNAMSTPMHSGIMKNGT